MQQNENSSPTEEAPESAPTQVKDHDRKSENSDNLARRLGWIGTLSGILSVFVAVAALLLGYDARNESQKLEVNGLLDEAWDALGGSPNTSFISDFSGSDMEKARRAIRDAREILPNDPRVRLVVAAIYVANNELDKAETELERGLTNLPNDFDLRFNLAVVLRMQEKWSAAIREFQAAGALAPRDASPHLGLGNLFRARGDLEQAVKHYRLGIGIDNHDAQLHESFGSTLLDQNKVTEGISALREAVRLSPNIAEYRF